MPTYTYRIDSKQADDGCPVCGDDGFQTVQPLSAPNLTACPSCEAPIRRVIRPGAVCMTKVRWTDKKLLSNDNLRDKGFKKLVKDGDKYVDVLRT